MNAEYNCDLASGLKRMLKESKYSDVTIVCEEKTFHCHKVILAAVSLYFETMFDAGLQESESGRVCLDDVLSEDLCEVFLDYVYTGSVQVDDENADSLLHVSHMMQINSLRETCIDYLRVNLKKNNCLRVWQTVSHYNIPELEAKALSTVKKYFQEICDTQDFKELREKAYILKLLTGEHLNCHDENKICRAILSWICADFENRSDYLEEILKALTGIPVSVDVVLENAAHFEELQNSVMFRNTIDSLRRSVVPLLQEGSLRDPRYLHEDVLMIVGGKDLGENTDVYGFSLSQKRWFRMANVPKDPGYSFAICSRGKDLFLSGGTSGKDNFFRYDGDANTWEEYPKMNSARHHHCMAAVGDNVYVLGGRLNPQSIPYKEIDIFSIHENRWKPFGYGNHTLPIAVRSASCVVHENKIYVLGGFCDGTKKSEYLQEFDTKKLYSRREEWYKLPEEIRLQAKYLVIKDKIYSISKSGKVYEIPSQSQVKQVGKITTNAFPRKGFGVCASEGNIMIIGGEVDYQASKEMLQYCIEDGGIFTMNETLPVPLQNFEFTKMILPRHILTEINAVK